jgi:hypothetical protein
MEGSRGEIPVHLAKASRPVLEAHLEDASERVGGSSPLQGFAKAL